MLMNNLHYEFMAIILHQLVTVRCSNNQFHAFSHALGLEKYLQSSLISFCQILFFSPPQYKSLGNSLHPVLPAYHTDQYCLTAAFNSPQ